MSATSYRIRALAPALVEQLLRGDVLPAGSYNIRLRPAAMAGQFDVLVDGAVTRAGLHPSKAIRAVTLLRAAFLIDWSGR